MRWRAICELSAALSGLFLLIWGIFIISDDTVNPLEIIKLKLDNKPKDQLEEFAQKCSVSKACPPESYTFHIWSGAANIVGPKICFDGKIIMSHVLNNIGPGINIVVINYGSGVVEKFGFLNMETGNKDAILEFLKTIPPDSIVLVASYRDVTPQLTDEMRDLFEGMGSTMIKSIKQRDGWVFVGRMGAKEKSIFEKVSVNDKETNLYEDWPRVVDLAGCYLKELPSDHETRTPEYKKIV